MTIQRWRGSLFRRSCVLIAEEVRKTIERLYLRMWDRFPQSNLANICRELPEIAEDTPQTVQWIATPNYWLRFGTYGFILVVVLLLVQALRQLDLPADGINLATLVQLIDSALNSIAEHGLPTAHAPQPVLTQYELARYPDYCTEMLSLTSKTAFLYVQDYHDPVAVEAVNDLEDLTNGLSGTIWQKVMMLPTQENGGPRTKGDARGR